MAKVYLLLGGNQGDRLNLLEKARAFIAKNIGEIVNKSSVYETEPWGFEDDSFFLNQLLIVETKLIPEAVLEGVLKIENLLGRVRAEEHMTGRTMDIDIMFFDDVIVELESLTIPHPRLQLRRFSLEPLNEIASDLVHPVLAKTMSTLLHECVDTQRVSVIAEH